MTNYNYGRYLREALDSALNQTVAAHEVVLVDDGATDDSRDVLESYGDQIVTVLTENRGHAAAMTTAVSHCSGEVVATLDADDLMAPNRVESLVTMYETIPDAHWVFNGLDHIDRETHELLESPPPPAPGLHDERKSYHWGRISLNAPPQLRCRGDSIVSSGYFRFPMASFAQTTPSSSPPSSWHQDGSCPSR